jgi:Fe2+ transport system protein FeoA
VSCRCPLCGAGMGAGGEAGCARCPLAFRCDLLRCASCGYQFPRGSKLLAWAKRLLRRTSGVTPRPATLDDVEGGTTCVISAVSGDPALRVRLAHLGLAEGAFVRVDQRRPAVVLRIGATRFAVEPDIARRVTVHAAGAA